MAGDAAGAARAAEVVGEQARQRVDHHRRARLGRVDQRDGARRQVGDERELTDRVGVDTVGLVGDHRQAGVAADAGQAVGVVAQRQALAATTVEGAAADVPVDPADRRVAADRDEQAGVAAADVLDRQRAGEVADPDRGPGPGLARGVMEEDRLVALERLQRALVGRAAGGDGAVGLPAGHDVGDRRRVVAGDGAGVVAEVGVGRGDEQRALVGAEHDAGREEELIGRRADLVGRGRARGDEAEREDRCRLGRRDHGDHLGPGGPLSGCPRGLDHAGRRSRAHDGLPPPSAARAAATRAIGTRNGEHDT